MTAERLRFIHLWCENTEFGRVMAVTRQNSRFGDGPSVESVEDVRWIRKQNPKSEREARRQCNVGAGDWLVQDFEPNTDSCFVNKPDSASSESNASISESHHRSHFSVVATVDLLVHQMAKRSHPFADEASKFIGASSNLEPVGKRVLALAAVRHDRSSPLIIAQEKTQSDVKGHVNPGQASGDGLHFPGSTRNSRVTESEASDLEGCCWIPKRKQMLRRHLDAMSPIMPTSRQHETDCSQKKMMTFQIQGVFRW